MMTAKNWRCLILFCAMALAVLVSCNGADEKNETAPENAISSGENKEATDNAPRMYPDVPEITFGEYSFTFLSVYSGHADWTDWNTRDIYSEHMDGEPINDAVFTRNSAIEEKFGIQIKEVREENVSTKMRASVAAGDNMYDVVMPRLGEVVSLAQEGLLTDIREIPYIDLEKPWWSRSCAEQMSVGNRLYFIQGDLTVIDKDAMEAMVFNKKLIRENEIEIPYDLVNSGKWTIDKMIEQSKDISMDLNSDGKMNLRDDRFGLVVQRTSFLSYYGAAGGTIIDKDKNDLPYVNFASEKNYALLDKLTLMMRDKENVVDLHRYEGQFPIYEEQAKMFSEDRGLSMWIRMRIVENLRNMETDFGIVPLPKYDENQKNYISRMNPNVSTVIAVLKTESDLERTGIILEALTCESKYVLQPAYYDITLKVKNTRDTESEAMLDIIYDNRYTQYDIAEIYNFGNFAGTIRAIPTHDGDASYASQFEKFESAMQKAIDKTIENYEKAAN
ncbi:MAG: hypothetical protein FWG34_01825 [Oscillospiraceae bacterium]|nr:hypothetical protein [Oscillospiraceae bacterium]